MKGTGEGRQEEKGRGLSLRRLVGKRAFLGWLLERKDSCPISCPPSCRGLFKVRLLCILRQLLMVCFSTLFLLILG